MIAYIENRGLETKRTKPSTTMEKDIIYDPRSSAGYDLAVELCQSIEDSESTQKQHTKDGVAQDGKNPEDWYHEEHKDSNEDDGIHETYTCYLDMVSVNCKNIGNERKKLSEELVKRGGAKLEENVHDTLFREAVEKYGFWVDNWPRDFQVKVAVKTMEYYQQQGIAFW